MSLLQNQGHDERPWGNFERFTLNEPSTVKIISIKPHQGLSLQTHARRSEFWHILSGAGQVRLGDETREAHAGDEFEIPIGLPHRATAGDDELVFLEVALGDFDEDDETRLEDDYGRGSPAA